MAIKKGKSEEDAKKKAEKEAKKAARKEALKNRPVGQRTNSKQIDVIDLGNGKMIKNYGYPVKAKKDFVGVLVTSVVMNGEEVVSESVTFVPGKLTVKAKKGHGIICSPKSKKHDDDTDSDDEEVSEEKEAEEKEDKKEKGKKKED